MKKKLALACTLIHTPELIFLDEPSTGVDPVSRGEFWNILSDILAEGVTIVMTTPYLDEAERCHRIGLIHHGVIIQTGTPEEVKAALPGKIYRIETPSLEQAHRLLRQKWPPTNLVRYGDRLNFWSQQGEAEIAEATEWLRRQGLGLVTFTPIAPSLEDVFVALMGSQPSQGEQP
jgi:ABC-2 type transport system ATP-binding protein